MKKKPLETLYLGQDFKKRSFPQEPRQVEILFKETPLFKATEKAEKNDKQLTLFEKGARDHESGKESGKEDVYDGPF